MKWQAVGSVQPCTAVSEKLALLMSKKIEPWAFTLIRAAAVVTAGSNTVADPVFGTAEARV